MNQCDTVSDELDLHVQPLADAKTAARLRTSKARRHELIPCLRRGKKLEHFQP